MNWIEPLASLGGAIIGALAAIGATILSLRRAAADARAESLSGERSSLQALQLEMAVVEKIARAGSVIRLPTQMLEASIAGIHHMGLIEKAALLRYTESIYRYNGRAERIIAFGAGKRAAGGTPGIEKVGGQHIGPVLDSIEQASIAIARQLESARLNPGKRRALEEPQS